MLVAFAARLRRHADGLASRRPSANAAWSSPPTCSLPGGPTSTSTTTAIASRLRSRQVQTELRQLLQDASPKSRRTRWHRCFPNLLKVWPRSEFTTDPETEPTNNPAERALRAPVIHRKISLGTQSKTGERFAERALSAAATCRLQRRSLFTYLSDLNTAHNRGDPFPALT